MRVFLFLLMASCSMTVHAQQGDCDDAAADQSIITVGPITAATWSSRTITYRCDQDVKLQVAYLNMKTGESFASLFYDGRITLLRVGPSASGVRYIAVDEQHSLRWHTKGDWGTLKFLEADHTAEEEILLADCRAMSPMAESVNDDEISLHQLPPEISSHIEAGTRPLALESADLNGNGLEDFVLVLERRNTQSTDTGITEYQRPLLILLRQPGGELGQVKRNDRLVYCSTCGGMLGDPFIGIQAGPGTFTVSHYGGSSWRWSSDYTFVYSQQDATWHLARVEESSFHAGKPDDIEIMVYTPPTHFGKIDVADFDPENWKDAGSR